jgi:hypothetical protein
MVHSGHGVRSSPETSQSDTRTDPLLHPSLGALHADTTIGRDRCTTPLQGGTDQAQVQAQAQAARRACWCGAVLCPALLGSAIDPKASPGPGPGQASAVALEIDSIPSGTPESESFAAACGGVARHTTPVMVIAHSSASNPPIQYLLICPARPRLTPSYS